jgi:uncharacterized protein
MSTADPVSQPDTPHEGLLVRHPLVFFFLIAYVGSWLVWLPYVLSQDGVGLLPFGSPMDFYGTFAIGVYLGPFLSAFILTSIIEGRPGIRRLLRRFVSWRVGLLWYLFVFIGIPLILVLGAIVLPGALASFDADGIPSVLPYIGLFVLAVLGGGQEEPGWRGFALPRLQQLHGPLVGTLVLGTLWGLWHLPFFLIPGYPGSGTSLLSILVSFVLFCISVVLISIIFTWVFNHTYGSVLMAVLLHASFNTFTGTLNNLFPTPMVRSNVTECAVLVGYGVVALVLVASTRGRLGYKQEEREALTAPT